MLRLLGQATDWTNAMRTRDGCGGDKRRREDVTDAEETSDGPTDAASTSDRCVRRGTTRRIDSVQF